MKRGLFLKIFSGITSEIVDWAKLAGSTDPRTGTKHRNTSASHGYLKVAFWTKHQLIKMACSLPPLFSLTPLIWGNEIWKACYPMNLELGKKWSSATSEVVEFKLHHACCLTVIFRAMKDWLQEKEVSSILSFILTKLGKNKEACRIPSILYLFKSVVLP